MYKTALQDANQCQRKHVLTVLATNVQITNHNTAIPNSVYLIRTRVRM